MLQSDSTAHAPYQDLLSFVFGQSHDDIDKPLYVNAHDPTKYVTEREALVTVKTLIAGLRHHGVKAGDSICLHSFNNIHYALFFLAIVGCGARYVGTNPAYTVPELLQIASISQVKFFIAESELLDKIIPVAAECNIPEKNVFVLDSEEYSNGRFSDSQCLMMHGESAWEQFDSETRAKQTVAALLTTSGTTGLPKAAKISHFAFVAQAQMINADTDLKPRPIRRLLSLPQFHAFAGPLMNLSPLLKSIPTYIMKRFVLDEYVDFTQKYQITETAVVNPILLGLLALTASRQKHLDSLRMVWVAGAPLSASTQNRFAGILNPDARVAQVFGMTEIGWITSLLYPEKDETGSAGRLLPGMQAMWVALADEWCAPAQANDVLLRIVDESGEELTEEGVPGHILLRGPSMMAGYLANDAATAETIRNGWLYSGDVGHQRGGKFYVYDRIKDMIKVRAWQVSPAEVEACLIGHPNILDAAVVGVNPTGTGEVPRAYVVMDNPESGLPSDQELVEYLKERLASYKLPAGGIWRVESIPRNPSGKILKKLLRVQDQPDVQVGAGGVPANGTGRNASGIQAH